jgi:hypothetical protein
VPEVKTLLVTFLQRLIILEVIVTVVGMIMLARQWGGW